MANAPRAAAAPAYADATALGMNSGHTGVSNDPVGPDWTQKWSVTESANVGYPVIAGGQVIVATQGASPTLTAFDADTGAVDWSDNIGANLTGITYQTGQVFEQSGDTLSAYNSTNGSLDWSKAIPGQDSFTSAPTAANGLVYTDGAGIGGTLYAFSQSTGSLVWSAGVTNGDDSSPAVDSGSVYVSFACDLTQAFDAASGHSLWTYENACEGGGGQTAVLADGDLFLRDQILNATTGKTVRSFASDTTPAVDSQNDYAESGGSLRGETVGSGRTLWSTTGDGGLDTAPIEVDGVVYDGSSTGHLYGYSAATGQQLADLNVGTAFQSDSNTVAEGDGLLAAGAGETLAVYGEAGTPPNVPTAVTATAGDTEATVDWSAPPDNGSAITDFTITPIAGGVDGTPFVVAAGALGSATDPTAGASDQATVTGLTDGISYTFTIEADNAGGSGTASAPSSPVTPTALPPDPPAVTGTDATAYGMNAAHSGVSTDAVGPTWTQKWSVTGSGWVGYPVITGGQVITLVHGPSTSLVAYDASTGAIDWSDSVGFSKLGLTYQSGRVFEESASVVGTGGLLSAYDASTGKLDWSTTIPGQYSFSSAPTAANGLVYTDGAGSGGTLYAFSQTTGSLVWSAGVTNGDDSSPAVDSGSVYVSFACDLSQAFNATSGRSLWTYENGCEGGGGQTAVLADGDLFLRDQILNASTGTTARSFTSTPTPAVDNSNDYADYQGTLRGETVSSGGALWSTTGDGGLDTPPIEVNGVVYEGSSSGHVYGYTAATGAQVADLNVGTPVTAPSGAGGDSSWGLAEGDGLLAVPAGNTLTVYGQPGTPPAAPTAVTATAGDSQAMLHWTVPADNGQAISDFVIIPIANGVAQQQVVVPAGAAGSATDPTPGAMDQASVTGLTNGTSYTFRVAAANSGGPGPNSDASSPITVAGVPGPPTGISAYAGQQAALLGWTVPSDNGAPISDFKITWYQDGAVAGSQELPAGSSGSALDPTPGAADSYEVTGLPGGTALTFTVAAVNSTGQGPNSSPSPPVTPTSSPNVPYPPTGTSAATALQGQATVSWTVPPNNGAAISGFEITPSLNGVPQAAVTVPAGTVGSNLDPTPGASDSDTLSRLPGGSYTFTVAATNSAGTGPASAATNSVVVVSPFPAAPSSVFASSPGPNMATVNWVVPANNGSAITNFMITRYDGSTSTVTDIAAGAPGSSLSPVQGAPDGYTFSGLASGEYWFTVAAVNAVGAGPPSSPSGDVFVPTPGQLVASPNTVNFGSVSLGDITAARNVTLTNRGDTAAQITGFAVSGDDFDFVAETNCPSTLGAGQACGLAFAFLPGALGLRKVTIKPLAGSISVPTIVVEGTGTEGYYIATANGAVHAFGDAKWHGDLSHTALPAPIVTVASTGDGAYWLVGADGSVHAYGDAQSFGSLAGIHLAKPIEGMSPTPDDGGYWMTASDGGIFTFGDARFYGSTGNVHLHQPIVGMTTTPDGHGYWLVASDGGIFTFGDARFYGSTGAVHLHKPIVGMTVTPDGRGYWLVASDGGIFTFGDARFYGSTGGIHLTRAIIGMRATPDGRGYWLIASDGGIFTFGDARFYGSTGGGAVDNVVGMALSGGYTFQAFDHLPA